MKQAWGSEAGFRSVLRDDSEEIGFCPFNYHRMILGAGKRAVAEVCKFGIG